MAPSIIDAHPMGKDYRISGWLLAILLKLVHFIKHMNNASHTAECHVHHLPNHGSKSASTILNDTPHEERSGFSLVELSIVLVILGLLTGGILGGQSLIRAAELRAVTTEYQRYTAAITTFRDKYFAIPGDMSNATQFWGRLNTNADCVSNSGLTTASTPGTCDGNGSGSMDWPSAASKSGELYQFWRQLALAGLLEGSYTGLAGSAGASDSVLGSNVPKSRLNNAGWTTWNAGVYAGGSSDYAADYGNIFSFGSQVSGGATQGSALKPEESWNIDTKMDDGMPGTGKILARENGTFHNPATSVQCTASTSSTNYTSAYNLSNSSVICSLYFVKVY